MPDHVHLLIEVDPQFGIHKAVKQIKGYTSHVLRDEFPSLRSKLPTLWTYSYFVSTVGEVVFIDRFYPSSQTCNSCGVKCPGVKDLGVREWTCPSCGTYHDRDVNAAINILNEGLRLMSA